MFSNYQLNLQADIYLSNTTLFVLRRHNLLNIHYFFISFSFRQRTFDYFFNSLSRNVPDFTVKYTIAIKLEYCFNRIILQEINKPFQLVLVHLLYLFHYHFHLEIHNINFSDKNQHNTVIGNLFMPCLQVILILA